MDFALAGSLRAGTAAASRTLQFLTTLTACLRRSHRFQRKAHRSREKTEKRDQADQRLSAAKLFQRWEHGQEHQRCHYKKAFYGGYGSAETGRYLHCIDEHSENATQIRQKSASGSQRNPLRFRMVNGLTIRSITGNILMFVRMLCLCAAADFEPSPVHQTLWSHFP